MAWIPFTEDHLKLKLSGVELSTFRSVALAAGQPDPVAGVLNFTCDYVRGFVGACRRNVLGIPTTIPEELISIAVDIAVMEVMKRAAGKVMDQNNVRQNAYNDALSTLKMVAACEFGIVNPPPDQVGPQVNVVLPSFSSRRIQRFGADYEDGV